MYTRLPVPQAETASKVSTLRSEVLRLNREMTNTSAQDDFAKWAKLRRAHDKAKDQHDKLSQSQQAFRSKFDKAVGVLRWLGTTGLRMLLQFWFSKRPMFWLPKGWVPGLVEWGLSFPRAPVGAVSINVWAIACGSVIGLFNEGVVALVAIGKGSVPVGQGKGEKIRVEMPPMGVRGGEKKEL